MNISCTNCTFLNYKSNKSCEMCSHLFVEHKVSISTITYIFTTENAGILSIFFINCLEMALGVDISLSYICGTSHQIITDKKDGIKITLMQRGKKYGHYTLITSNGSELDFGIYNTKPLNIPLNVEKSYFQCLKKNEWGKKKHGNCCLPMCIIIGVLIHQQELQDFIDQKHQQELQDLDFALKIQMFEL
jgi:hypothetical protein